MSGFLEWIFGGRLREPEGPKGPELSSAHVEAMISQAGREDVFAEARALGWTTYNPPPLWVWQQIASDVMRRKTAAMRGELSKRLH